MMYATRSRARGHRVGPAQQHWDEGWGVPVSSSTMSSQTVHVLLVGTKVPHKVAQPCRVLFSESENLGWGLGFAEVSNIPSLVLSFLFCRIWFPHSSQGCQRIGWILWAEWVHGVHQNVYSSHVHKSQTMAMLFQWPLSPRLLFLGQPFQV